MARWPALLATGLLVTAVGPLLAQVGLAAGVQAVHLTVWKPGSITVSLRPGTRDVAPVPVSTRWNVDPSQTASFTVVAYFRESGQAVTTPPGGPVAIDRTTLGSAGAGVVLFTQPVVAVNAMGERSDQVQVGIEFTTPGLLPDTLTGQLDLVAITQ